MAWGRRAKMGNGAGMASGWPGKAFYGINHAWPEPGGNQGMAGKDPAGLVRLWGWPRFSGAGGGACGLVRGAPAPAWHARFPPAREDAPPWRGA